MVVVAGRGAQSRAEILDYTVILRPGSRASRDEMAVEVGTVDVIVGCAHITCIKLKAHQGRSDLSRAPGSSPNLPSNEHEYIWATAADSLDWLIHSARAFESHAEPTS